MNFIISSIAIAFVASAETLLSVTAVDKLAGRGISNYNKEIMAQGFGNMLAGVFGALPITGVIVRSSANIEAGAETRVSAILHGIWLFALVFFFTDILALIPVSALAGILIFTGWKLLDIKSIPALLKRSKAEALIYFVTFGLIVSVDLLTGVIVGFLTSVAVLVHKLHSLEVHRVENENDITVSFKGTASFLQVPKISMHLSNVPTNKSVTLHLGGLNYLDWAVEEQLTAWKDIQVKKGIDAQIIYRLGHNKDDYGEAS
jgi:MFS superfamily sulfate permease-like transporter